MVVAVVKAVRARRVRRRMVGSGWDIEGRTRMNRELNVAQSCYFPRDLWAKKPITET